MLQLLNNGIRFTYMRTRETTYRCDTCGERHPRPDHYDLAELSPEMRMIAFLHAIGQNAADYINKEQG